MVDLLKMKTLKICKVFGQAGFSTVLLVAFFLSQLTLVLICNRKEGTDLNVWYAGLLIVLLVPEAIHMFLVIWNTSFLTDGSMKDWPIFRRIFSGMIMSITEAGCMSLLTFILLPRIPGYILLPLLNLSLLPELSYTVKNLGYNRTTDCLEPSIRIVLWIAMLLSGIIASVFLANTDILLPYQAAVFPLVLIGSSLSMYTPIQQYTYGTSDASVYNTSLLYGSLRIATYMLSCIMCFNNEMTGTDYLDIEQLWNGFENVSEFETFSHLIVGHITISLAAQIVYIIPGKSSFTVFCPMFLSPILVSIAFISIIMHGTTGMHILETSIARIPTTPDHIALICMCAVIITIPLFFMILSYCVKNVGRTEHFVDIKSRCVHRYCSIRLLQFILFAKKVFRKHMHDGNRQTNKQTRVFICTTMSQEAEHEMERLLLSLNNVITSQKLRRKNILLESHIFLDNGADGKEMKDFGKQLLALVEESINLKPDSGLMLYTPYGIQLHWVLDNGTPLYIHLKDIKKVKAKKRWSQIMYLEYILKYRSKRAFQQNIYERNTMSSNPSFASSSIESLDRLSAYYSASDVAVCEAINTKYASGNYLDVPDIILHHSGEDADDDSDVDFASTDGSISPGERRCANGNVSIAKEIPLEIHTQDSTVYSVSISAPDSSPSAIPSTTNDYILMTDADMSFDADAVLGVVNVCNQQPDVGGVCGRTYPTGLYRHPIIWLQMFEYAKDFWMIKSSQNVIGSVMCCPGCFSLFRFEALQDILTTYSSFPKKTLDVFTMDNGEDRWMCTLMMFKGWKLRYTPNGKNSTYCPDSSLEFMKQRRRWLLSDYANALVVAKHLADLMTTNSAFSLVYAFYILQLFFIMVLYPGATIIMLSLGLELASGIPLLAIVATFYVVIVGYSLVLVSNISSSAQLVVSKLLILVLGFGTLYVFGATAVIIVKAMILDYQQQAFHHIEYVLLLSLAGTYLFAALLHPSELHLLLYGLPYMFFLPFLNIILPIYALCNIVDQSWGTRDNQIAKVPKFLSMPKVKKRKKKRNTKSLSSRKGSYASWNSSVLDLQHFNDDEESFWTKVVDNDVGVHVVGGMTPEERTEGLRAMRKKVVIGFLVVNAVWVIGLCVCYGFLLQQMDDNTIFSIVLLSSLGLTPLVQVTGMVINRVDILCGKIGQMF